MHAWPIFFLLSLTSAAPAPLYKREGSDPHHADTYIVKLKQSSEIHVLDDVLSSYSINAKHVYKDVFNGFAASFDATTLTKLRNHPEVEYIEEDSTFSIAAYTSQPNGPWNLARISHRARGATTYDFDDSAGGGACVYILDTGVEITHSQLGGRAVNGASFAGGSSGDGNGHGTAIAGIIGATIYGVAKKVTIISVKVLDDSGSGSTSGVIAGMNYVITDAATRNCPKGAMVNLSIGGGFSAAVNNAAAALVNSGKFVAAAAGNDAGNVANFSPGSEPLVCTVGATSSADVAASSSNTGPLLDIWAPGQSILTTYKNGGTITLSGSSIATPHIAGLGAYLAVLYGFNPSNLCAYIQQIATKGVLTGVPTGTVNLLAFNGNPSG